MASAPVVVTLGDELQALVYAHPIETRLKGDIRCLTFISNGLAAHGQKEVVWTIRDYLNDANSTPDNLKLPQEPLRWFEMLLGFARDGRVVDAFGVTEFEATDWFGRNDIRAIVYMPAQSIPSLPGTALPQSRLHAVPLTATERATVLLRVLALLGYATRYFPFPPWFDSRRPSVLTEAQLDSSILAKAPCTRVSGVSATRRVTSGSPEVVFRVRPGAVDALQAIVKARQKDDHIGLELELHEDADSCMVWVPGSGSLQAIGSGNTMYALGMCYILFWPQQAQFQLRQIEDGYVVFLTDEQWTRLSEALLRRQPLLFPADPGGSSFRLEWLEETLALDGSEVTLQVDHIVQEPTAHVFLDSVTLKDLASTPIAGQVLNIEAWIRDALASLLKVIPPFPPPEHVPERLKQDADVPQDVGSGDSDTDDEDREWWVLATLNFVHGAPAEMTFVVNPNDGRVDVEAMQRTLARVAMPDGTAACRFQMVLRLWRSVNAHGDANA